jgi:DNA-directed RNA polymerase specialized sigma24 family protein
MNVADKLTSPQAGLKRDWALTRDAFERLLDWLGQDSEPGGECYLEMRQRLVLYFDRKNCLSPDELADETLNRVARRLQEEGTIISDAPARYCYIVARLVFLESVRERQRQAPLDERLSAQTAANPEASEEQQESEQRWECLERCLGELEPGDRELIVNYYRGAARAKIENRRALAAQLGITLNALSIRACRLRDKLETCLRACLSGE